MVFFLTYLKEYRTLIIEEPEAHLHLKAQIAIARVYEFNTSEGKTTVTAIKNSETGFPLPTFNDVISKLTDEVMILLES